MKNILKLVFLLITMNSCGFGWFSPFNEEYETKIDSMFFSEEIINLIPYDVGDTFVLVNDIDTFVFECNRSQYRNDGYEKLCDENRQICNKYYYDYLNLKIIGKNDDNLQITIDISNGPYPSGGLNISSFFFGNSTRFQISPDRQNPIQFYGSFEGTVSFKPITSIDSIIYQDVNIIFNKEEKDTVYFNHTHGFLRFRNETVDYKLIPN